MPFRVLVGLIFCNVIWAANPIMGKLLLATFTPSQVAWLRYCSASAFFVIGVLGLRVSDLARKKSGARHFFAAIRSWREFVLVFGVGFSAFCFAPLVGFSGLNKTGAIDNALLVAMEPLVTVSLAMIFLGERLSRAQVLSFFFAILGFGLLSGLLLTPADQWISHPSIMGNLILVLSLIGEAGYSIFARQLAGRFAMTEVFGSSLLIGFAALTMTIAPFAGTPSWATLSQLGLKGWLAIVWLGPLGSTLTYLYWLVALDSTKVSSAALTLFIQPIVGALLGAWVLGEPLTAAKWTGGTLILLAVGLLTLRRQNS